MLCSDDPSLEIVTGVVSEHLLLPNYRTIVTPDTQIWGIIVMPDTKL